MVTPLFDSLSHPSLSGQYMGRPSAFGAIAAELQAAGFSHACAVGMPNDPSYEHSAFMAECRKYKEFVPIAPLDPRTCADVDQEISKITALGFKGIKIHPRFCRLTWEFPKLPEVLRAAQANNLRVLLCTYMHTPLPDYSASDPFFALVNLLKQVPDARVMLVHGGDVRVMQYAELVRFNPNLILDLSMTLMKYPLSSIDADLRFLFAHFDRRICIGSDSPEYSHADIRRRFEELSASISAEKKLNAGSLNLLRFFGLGDKG